MTPTAVYLKYSLTRREAKKSLEERKENKAKVTLTEIQEHISTELCRQIDLQPNNFAWYIKVPKSLYVGTWENSEEACEFLKQNLVPVENFDIEFLRVLKTTFQHIPYVCIQIKIKPNCDLLAYEDTITN